MSIIDELIDDDEKFKITSINKIDIYIKNERKNENIYTPFKYISFDTFDINNKLIPEFFRYKSEDRWYYSFKYIQKSISILNLFTSNLNLYIYYCINTPLPLIIIDNKVNPSYCAMIAPIIIENYESMEDIFINEIQPINHNEILEMLQSKETQENVQ